MDKTCSRSYPNPSLLHLFVISIACLAAPAFWYYSYRAGLSFPLLDNRYTYFTVIGQINPATWISDERRPVFIMSGAVVLMYAADRTGFWFKEQKQFDLWFFASLCIMTLLAGLGTVKKSNTDLGFSDRE